MVKPKRPRDPNQAAKFIVGLATGEIQENQQNTPKNQAAVTLSSMGASKGGTARAEKLTPKERQEIALKAAKTRWNKK